MSDKHEAKQKQMRAKAHLASAQMKMKPATESGIEGEIKQSAGNVQEDLGKFRASANRAHQG